MAITSAITKHGNNICHKLHWFIGDKNISHYNIKSWLKTLKIMVTILFGQKNKIQNYI